MYCWQFAGKKMLEIVEHKSVKVSVFILLEFRACVVSDCSFFMIFLYRKEFQHQAEQKNSWNFEQMSSL